jgi:hypothetical protein
MLYRDSSLLWDQWLWNPRSAGYLLLPGKLTITPSLAQVWFTLTGYINSQNRWYWRRLFSGLLCHVVLQKFTNVSQMLADSIIRPHCPDDGGSKNLWNVSKLLPDYTVQQCRIQPSSYSLPWEPDISQQIMVHRKSSCCSWSACTWFGTQSVVRNWSSENNRAICSTKQ